MSHDRNMTCAGALRRLAAACCACGADRKSLHGWVYADASGIFQDKAIHIFKLGGPLSTRIYMYKVGSKMPCGRGHGVLRVYTGISLIICPHGMAAALRRTRRSSYTRTDASWGVPREGASI